MAIITISRGSYSKGKAVAEGVAEKLGYECISRDILLEASERFNIPEIKLVHAIQDVPSILNRFSHGMETYISYIQAALLEHVKKGNVVYHGQAGQFLLKGIDPVLKVRILADLAIRVNVVMEREGVSEREASRMIARIDEERKKWSRRLYGLDPQDPALYDMVICIDKIKVEGAIGLICDMAEQEPFRITEGHHRKLGDLAVACKVKSEILDLDPNVDVQCEFGNVVVTTRGDERKARKLDEKVRDLAGKLEGVHNVEVRAGTVRFSQDA
jgi:cytidylate kinase